MTANGFNEFASSAQRSFTPNNGPPAPFQYVPANGLNFVGMRNAVAIHSQTQDGGQLVALAAVLVLAQANGVFDYDIDVAFADDTTAKTVRLRAILVPGGLGEPHGRQSAGLLEGFYQSVGSVSAENPYFGSAAVPYGLNPDGSSPLVGIAQLNQDSTGLTAKGLIFSGPGDTDTFPPIDTVENALILWDQEIDTLTGQLSNGDSAFHAHGRAGFDLGAAAPGFGVGNYAILVLELVSTSSEAGDVITFGSCSMSLAEVG